MPPKTTSQAISLTLVCCSALVVNTSVQASGFAVPELNIAGLATSNALVANPDTLGAISYNPAAMSFHEGSHAMFGTILVQPGMSVDQGSGFTDSDANELVPIPIATAHDKMNEDWALGISLNAPFGLETDWDVGVFKDQYPLGSPIPTKTLLEVVAFSPSASYKLNDQASVAFGVDYYWMKKVIFNSKINDNSAYPSFNLEGDNGRGAGLNLGGLLMIEDWSFGINFHSSSKIKVKGNLDDETGNLQAQGLSGNVTSSLELPWRLQLGTRYHATKKLAIEFDYTRTGWNKFDTLDVKSKEYGSTIFTSVNAFNNANAYRLGVTYDYTQATQLRVGYSYDESPQQEKYFSPRVPDADRQLFSLGLGHRFSDDWTVEIAYMYVDFEDRTIDSNTAAIPGQELNGTAAVNGTYESTVQLFGVGITKTFM
jgi:long-chain fatty acid transport protein